MERFKMGIEARRVQKEYGINLRMHKYSNTNYVATSTKQPRHQEVNNLVEYWALMMHRIKQGQVERIMHHIGSNLFEPCLNMMKTIGASLDVLDENSLERCLLSFLKTIFPLHHNYSFLTTGKMKLRTMGGPPSDYDELTAEGKQALQRLTGYLFDREAWDESQVLKDVSTTKKVDLEAALVALHFALGIVPPYYYNGEEAIVLD